MGSGRLPWLQAEMDAQRTFLIGGGGAVTTQTASQRGLTLVREAYNKLENFGNPTPRMLVPFPCLLNFRIWQSFKPNNSRVQKPTESRTISASLLQTGCL